MKVLFATDGEAPARAAAEVLARFFDPSSTKIDPFVVSRPSTYDLWAADQEVPWEALDLPTPSAHALALDAAEWFEDRGFEASPLTADGNAAVEVIRMAEKGGYDLVALGGGHTSWLGNVLLGSVSVHVLHHTTCSVLIAHEAPTDNRVLIGTDGSEDAGHAIDLVAGSFDRGAQVRVATVVPFEYSAVAIPHYGMATGIPLEVQGGIRREALARAHALVEGAVKPLKAGGSDADAVVIQGSPAIQLLKEAENFGAGLVVVGSTGRGPLERAVLGSVSDRIVRHAPATLVARKHLT